MDPQEANRLRQMYQLTIQALLDNGMSSIMVTEVTTAHDSCLPPFRW